MAHQAQLANVKYRNWVRAGLGIKYVKEGLEPFCDDLVSQQHSDILNRIQLTHNVSAVSCGYCNVRSLQPNHVRTRNKICPLAQINCNCQYPGGKILCPSNLCGAIYDEIIQLHASTPPAPYWKNTDARQWCTEPWSVAKCFINAPGYEQKAKANEFDCSGYLHVLINNKGFHRHIKCRISGTDVFTRVRKSRNEIYHSNSMELEDNEVNSYIDDMIELLEDDKEIKHRQDSKDAVKKLQELKQENFIISTTDETEIRRVAMAAINEKENELKQTITDADTKLKSTADEEKHDIEEKGQKIRQHLAAKEAELDQTGLKIKKDLEKKEAEFEQTGQKLKQDLEKKGVEFEQTGQKIKRNLVLTEEDSTKKIEQKGVDIEKQLTRKKVEATEQIEQKLEESRLQLESHQNVIERSIGNSAETRKDDMASKEKKDFQKKLVKLYERDVIKVTPLPRLYQNKRNVDNMYVSSLMTEDMKNETSGRWEEDKIPMEKIFRKKEKPAKYVYVIGEAGSGKSTLCKMLVHFWCIAHSHQDDSKDKSNMVTEMERFDFLFYVSLRNYSDCGCIEKMLEKSFYDPALGGILQYDSSNCLIILDGLDEWNMERKYNSQFQIPGLPGREIDADYTIITTSRQWKFDVLSLSDSEIGKKIKLHGIDGYEIRNLTVKTVETLNDIHKQNKDAEECIHDLESRQVSDISHTPLMLQQLVCLWFKDKLRGDSKCALYGCMLDLFLEWKSLDTSEIQDHLYVIQALSRNTHVKQYLSYLAYETLFDRNKESTLTFSSFKLIQLSIPRDVIKDCLASGILREERNVSLSENMQSTISFFHKSVQEYLAAMYIARQFNENLSQQDEDAVTLVGKQCVDKYFGSCKTVVDILDQSNVLSMLCRLEPRLLTNVSEYIYNVSLLDQEVVKERNEIPGNDRLDINLKLTIAIQTCIFKCIEEVLCSSQSESVHSPVYIADLFIDNKKNWLRYVRNIILKNILSVAIYQSKNYFINYNEYMEGFREYLTKCYQLKVMKFENNASSDKSVIKGVISILEANVKTLATVSLVRLSETIISCLISKLTKMRRLTSLHVSMESDRVLSSLQVERSRVPHNAILSLSKFLNNTKRLQHISLDIGCAKCDTHKINLSKNKHLQHAYFPNSSYCMISCKTDNLETCRLSITSVDRMKNVFSILRKADKLKQLSLYGRRGVRYNETQSRKITENLIRLLPSLVSLNTLGFSKLTISDNILARPCDMKNLKEIKLSMVTMSMTAWCKFIDCLHALPQVVAVETVWMVFKDETVCSRMPSERKEEYAEAKARQYVRDKTNLFHVTKDNTFSFQFTTKDD